MLICRAINHIPAVKDEIDIPLCTEVLSQSSQNIRYLFRVSFLLLVSHGVGAQVRVCNIDEPCHFLVQPSSQVQGGPDVADS